MKTLLLVVLALALGLQITGCHALFGGPPIEVEIFNFLQKTVNLILLQDKEEL